jgi:hypothetical protein
MFVYEDVFKQVCLDLKSNPENYFNNFSHWFIHITALNKVAKDGDITRVISCKYWESERGGQTCTTRVTDGGSKPIPDTEVDKTSLIFGGCV